MIDGKEDTPSFRAVDLRIIAICEESARLELLELFSERFVCHI